MKRCAVVSYGFKVYPPETAFHFTNVILLDALPVEQLDVVNIQQRTMPPLPADRETLRGVVQTVGILYSFVYFLQDYFLPMLKVVTWICNWDGNEITNWVNYKKVPSESQIQ